MTRKKLPLRDEHPDFLDMLCAGVSIQFFLHHFISGDVTFLFVHFLKNDETDSSSFSFGAIALFCTPYCCPERVVIPRGFANLEARW